VTVGTDFGAGLRTWNVTDIAGTEPNGHPADRDLTKRARRPS
jgi:hypothetical protein